MAGPPQPENTNSCSPDAGRDSAFSEANATTVIATAVIKFLDTIMTPCQAVRCPICIILYCMIGLKNALRLTALTIVLAACVSMPQPVPAGAACETRKFLVLDDFDGARRGQCEALAPGRVRVHIGPEDGSVSNPSPWYAFKLVPHGPSTAVIEIVYEDDEHRYFPKISDDGVTWRRLDNQHIEVSADKSSAHLTVRLNNNPVWVAAQELLVEKYYEDWYETLTASRNVEVAEIGRSTEDRPVVALSHETKAGEIVLLVGRQHPPEVTGALAMRVFVDTVFADTNLAHEFRERFRVIAIPLLNPDGVAKGHWRHNAGGVDLNRDWGPFSQPETAAVRRLLDRVDSSGDKLRLFLDFHSTNRNLFYTQMHDDPTSLPGFAEAWFARALEDIGGYAFSHEPRPVSDATNGKQYMYRRYGVPSMTYEVGDESDRESIESSARVFAEAMMRELLAR